MMMKKLGNIEKGLKDVKYLTTFPTVSKLNRVNVCEVMEIVFLESQCGTFSILNPLFGQMSHLLHKME